MIDGSIASIGHIQAFIAGAKVAPIFEAILQKSRAQLASH